MTDTATAPAFSPGMAGVIAGETAVCSVEQGKLIYRGYEIHELAEHATFEEVAFVLLVGHKPSGEELRFFTDELVANRALPPVVIETIRAAGPALKEGTAEPMDVVRTAVSVLGLVDPDAQDNSHEAELRKAKRLLAKIPTIIGHMQNIIDGRDLVAPETGGDANLSHAANLLFLMTGEKPSDRHTRIMDVSLILYAEHDYNASTFTARVIAGTLSDMHGAITGAIAALKGPLHGGANEQAMVMLREVREHVDKGGAVLEWMDNAFHTKKKLMGFGHRVYKNGDHRAPILRQHGVALAEQLSSVDNEDALKWFEIADEVQRIMLEHKKIHPNVDYPCGLTYFLMGIPVPQYTPIFVASRVSGWAAHIMEQHAANKLIRPGSVYTGPAPRPWLEG